MSNDFIYDFFVLLMGFMCFMVFIYGFFMKLKNTKNPINAAYFLRSFDTGVETVRLRSEGRLCAGFSHLRDDLESMDGAIIPPCARCTHLGASCSCGRSTPPLTSSQLRKPTGSPCLLYTSPSPRD